MRYALYLLLICLAACESAIKYPEGGYDYPVNIKGVDSNLYFYPLKKVSSPEDAFFYSHSCLFYQPFHEPNLSIGPQPKETFRFTYSDAFGACVIITLTEDSIKIKKGNSAALYKEDTSCLSEVERLHWFLLRRRYPIDTTNKRPFMKHDVDSLVKLNPELLDPTYYDKLYKKAIVQDIKKFSYTHIENRISRQQFNSWVNKINASGFWAKPYAIKCDVDMMDGDGFRLEANTRGKYKTVEVAGCPNDTTKLTSACQDLIDLAKMRTGVHLIWDGRIDTVK